MTTAIEPLQRKCVGHQTISVLTSGVSTLTVPGNAKTAVIQADGNPVSLTLDGTTTPTASVGHRIDDGSSYYVDSDLSKVKLIARSATVNVQVTYYDKI